MNTQEPYWSDRDTLTEMYDTVAASGVKWVRVTLFWDLMEPARGGYDFAQADMIFDVIKQEGLSCVCVIRSAPSWACGGADTGEHNYMPTDADAYGDICYQIAKRYMDSGVDIVYEIGNEENTQFFNMPAVDPAGYTKNMLIPGAAGIRRAASELGVAAPTVLVGGFAPVEPRYVPNSVTPLDFMTAIYANGGAGSFDGVAYHPYTYCAAPTADHWTFTELQSLYELMSQNGGGAQKIWATEAGWATGPDGTADADNGQVSEADQAAFTGQLFDLWFSLPYAGPLLWYELADNASNDTDRENTFGLLRSDGTAKPAFAVFTARAAAELVTQEGAQQ